MDAIIAKIKEFFEGKSFTEIFEMFKSVISFFASL